MVRGIESFREWFRGYGEQYVIIGGTACDLLMIDEGLDFRATKDIDLVLIVEAMDAAFGRRFWEFVSVAGFKHRNKSTGEPQFYRFMNPQSMEYPVMIELFTRKPDAIVLPEDAYTKAQKRCVPADRVTRPEPGDFYVCVGYGFD